VRRHDGTVDKFTGDGMLGVFGLNGGDHARHALAAVADIRLAVEQLQTVLALRAPLDLRLGMGVHSGTVLVGCIGSAMRLEFTVIGDVVNTAFRLQDLCKDLKSDVLVSHETLRMCGDGTCQVRSLGHVAIRGRRHDLEVFALE
jgi:adenylate cyclase